MTPAERIEALRTTITRHDTLYYVHGEPAVTDAMYDKLFAELSALEKEHPDLVTLDSPTQRVGGAPIAGLETVDHLTPMLSIDNGFDLDVLDTFASRTAEVLGHDPDFTADWKIDGCAVGLVYENGQLIRMTSRGDGHAGDDITHNAISIRGIPQRLERLELPHTENGDDEIGVDGIVEVRGEAYIPNSVFLDIVAAQEKAGEKPFKNSRNATSGALRQLDPTECFKRGLRFVAHGVGQFDPEYVDDSYYRTLIALNLLGIPIISFGPGCFPYTIIKKQIEMMTTVMEMIDYPVDGIVLKLDNFSDRLMLGQKSTRHVSWALAYKWERYEAETKIVRLETQVGKQGTLTPVAYYEPVEIAETTVEKSTLFNFAEVTRLDPRVGDTVTLEKAGKIIPHLVRVHKDKRTGKPRKFMPPKTCPECGSPTGRDGPSVFCTNSAGCPAQLAAVIRSAADRTRLDIDGLGPVAIKAMLGSGAVFNLASLWTLQDTVDESGAIPGMTPGKSTKLLAALEGAKTRPSWRLMAALNIKHVGRTNSELICKAVTAKKGDACDVFATLAESWNMGDLMEIDGVGEETALSIRRWLDRKNNLEHLRKFRQASLNMGVSDPVEIEPTGKQSLAGLRICATGKLTGYTRESIKEAIVYHGGIVASSVSSKTDYLVAGADAGSKMAKAEKLGVAILTEEEFSQLTTAR